MNQMIEALQGIMNQANGEILNVAHPTDVANVETNILTGWHNSALKEDSYKDEDGDRHYNMVTGRLVLVTHLDAYNEPLGEPRLMLQHKYGHPTRQSKDISVTAVKPFEIRKVKARFPGAFDEYERKLRASGEDAPLVLLDDVPPEVIQILYTMGLRKVRDLAEFTEEQADTLRAKLDQHKMATRLAYVPRYVDIAKAMAGYASPQPKRSKAA